MSKLLFICALSAIVSVSFGLSCKSLTANSVKSFTTQDATIVSQIAYIAEFELVCDGPEAPIFAEFDGQLSPVSRTGANQFQVRLYFELNNSECNYYSVALLFIQSRKFHCDWYF